MCISPKTNLVWISFCRRRNLSNFSFNFKSVYKRRHQQIMVNNKHEQEYSVWYIQKYEGCLESLQEWKWTETTKPRTLSHKVRSSQVSSKTPRHHSIPYGHPFNPDFLRIYLISLSAISTTPSLLGKTGSNGVCHRLLIVPFALLLSHSCMSSLVVKHI
jgi:hypothetical protein